MKKTIIALLILAATVAAQDSKPKLTDDQYLKLRHALTAANDAQEKLQVLVNKLKDTPEWKAVEKSNKDYQDALKEATKGVDEKKWQLNQSLEFVPAEKAK